MRTMAVWIGAGLMTGGLWFVSAVSPGLADEPAAQSSSSETTGNAAGIKTGGSEAGPPVVEGQPGQPPEAGEVQSRAVPQLVRIQNYWKPYEYVNIQNGPVVAGPISVGWTSARWYLELIPGSTVYRIQNVWQGDRYLNIESGALQASTIAPGWVSARWTLEPVAGTVPTLYRIRNVWQPDQYLHIEFGALAAGAIQPGWLSAMWTLSFDATVVALPPVVQPTPNPPAFSPLPGEFTIRTLLKNTYLAAILDGPNGIGGIDVINTSFTTVRPNRLFKLASVQPDFTTIQTVHGDYLIADGGIGGLPGDTRLALRANATSPQTDIARFRVDAHSNPYGHRFFSYNIKTFSGYFLTAVGGGGQATGAFHTDATQASTWEIFWVSKCGDLGSGYTYAIRNTWQDNWRSSEVNWLSANGGGGRTTEAMTANGQSVDSSKFTLIRQGDGSYALQTSNRINYVTAVGGGGAPGPDNLHTDATKVQAWEQFKIVDQGDCTYTIQTVSGYFLAVGSGGISTFISFPNEAPKTGYSAKFELIMLGL